MTACSLMWLRLLLDLHEIRGLMSWILWLRMFCSTCSICGMVRSGVFRANLG